MSRPHKLLCFCAMCLSLLYGCFTFVQGGGRNAYKVEINAETMDEGNYHALRIPSILADRGYKLLWREKPLSPPSFQGQTGSVSMFEKIVTKEGYRVDIGIEYAQTVPESPVKKLRIWIVNWTVGNLNQSIIREIDGASQAIYNELVGIFGKDKITLTRQG